MYPLIVFASPYYARCHQYVALTLTLTLILEVTTTNIAWFETYDLKRRQAKEEKKEAIAKVYFNPNSNLLLNHAILDVVCLKCRVTILQVFPAGQPDSSLTMLPPTPGNPAVEAKDTAKAFRFSMILLFTTQVETTGVVPNLDCHSIFESIFTFLASFCIRMTIEMRNVV